MAKSEGKVDVFHYLRKLREQRVNMVQTVEQYILVHLLLMRCLGVRSAEIACDKTMRAAINNITIEKVQQQMKQLDHMGWQNDAIRSASTKSNDIVVAEKNRFNNIVPS